jgi:hypothetical protein
MQTQTQILIAPTTKIKQTMIMARMKKINQDFLTACRIVLDQ